MTTKSVAKIKLRIKSMGFTLLKSHLVIIVLEEKSTIPSATLAYTMNGIFLRE
jgi:hypothetical protein